MGFCNQILVAKVPITIGTIPIQNIEPHSTTPDSSAPPQSYTYTSSGNQPRNFQLFSNIWQGRFPFTVQSFHHTDEPQHITTSDGDDKILF